jgi:hypothetical protein
MSRSRSRVARLGPSAWNIFLAALPTPRTLIASALPGHDVIAVSLHSSPGDFPFAQSFRFPAGRTMERLPISELGLAGESTVHVDGTIELILSSRRFACGVRVVVPGFLPDDSYFGVEPGVKRRILLTPMRSGNTPTNLAVTAVNAEGRFPVAIKRRA